MRIGVLGGTFDPPHIGHLILAEQARDQLDLGIVLWVPAAEPPHKQGLTVSPAGHRLAMVQILLSTNSSFQVSSVDLKRLGPHYSVDMLDLIHAEYADDELYFLLGTDSLADLPTWHEPHRLIAHAKLVVMQRSAKRPDVAKLEPLIPRIRDHIIWLDSPATNISSSQIRDYVAQRRSIRYFLPDPVMDYLLLNELYKTTQ